MSIFLQTFGRSASHTHTRIKHQTCPSSPLDSLLLTAASLASPCIHIYIYIYIYTVDVECAAFTKLHSFDAALSLRQYAPQVLVETDCGDSLQAIHPFTTSLLAPPTTPSTPPPNRPLPNLTLPTLPLTLPTPNPPPIPPPSHEPCHVTSQVKFYLDAL